MLSKHDSWVYLVEGSPYDEIKSMFPEGFPVRDPFPMDYALVPPDLLPIPLWTIDYSRLTYAQSETLAKLIGSQCGVDFREVLLEAEAKGGFGLERRWAKRLECGAEGVQRTRELADFLKVNQEPTAEAWDKFFSDQFEHWIKGNEIPSNFALGGWDLCHAEELHGRHELPREPRQTRPP